MKICSHCQGPIPSYVIIQGKKRQVAHKRFTCFTCRPFGCKDTQTPLELLNINLAHKQNGFALCTKCRSPKPLAEFRLKNGNIKRRQAYCISCGQSIRQHRRAAFKTRCINYMGGKCKLCHYHRCRTALHFHHLVPTQKEFCIGDAMSLVWETVLKELDKCILVCSNCHGELHEGIRKLPQEIATPAGA